MKKITAFVAVLLIVLASVSITAAVENKINADLKAEYAADAEAGREEIEALRAQLQTMTEARQTEGAILKELFRQVDYRDEPVYVIGHKSPDLDTTASAIGMAYLLNELDIAAEARLAGPANLETEYALSVIGYPVPEILENAADKQLWLVDHADSQQMADGADKARIVGITDHHAIGDAVTADPINILFSPTGSTSALVFALCTKCDIDIPEDIAGVLLAGMLSDTSNMKSKDVTELDEAAFARLKEISGISDTDALFNGMLEAKLSYKGMDDRAIFYSDYKEYETNGVLYGIGVIKVAHPEQIPEMSERMLRVIKSEMDNGSDMHFLLFQVYDPEYSLGYAGFCGNDMEFTESIIDTAFRSCGEKRGEFYAFSPSLSRKTDMLPLIDNCLNALADVR